jgi:hypothetical protein
MNGSRDRALDRLRGLAIFLMIIDHSLLMTMTYVTDEPWMEWLRKTLTRLSLPLFMLVSGLLIARKGKPSWRRLPMVVVVAVVINVVSWYQVGFGVPEILAVWLMCLPLYPLFVRFPIETATLGILVTINLPITVDWWDGYQPALVLTFLALGSLLNRYANAPVLRAGERLPGLLEPIGKRPLLWYAGHLTVLAVIGGILSEDETLTRLLRI